MLHRNLSLKLVALGLAVFLWFWVLFTQRTVIVETSVKAPIEAREIAPGLALAEPLADAEVRLRGMKEDLASGPPAVKVYAPCSGLAAGRHLVPVKVEVPKRLTLVDVRPSRVEVNIEPLVKEQKPIEVRLNGSLSSEYELVGASVKPKYAHVAGVQSRVDRVARVVADVDLGRITTPELPVTAPIEPLTPAGTRVQDVTITPAHAEISLKVKPALVTRTVPVVPNVKGAPASGYRVTSVRVDPAVVTISGPAKKMKNLNNVGTERLSLDGLTTRVSRKVRVVVPEGVSVLRGGAITITIEVQRERGARSRR